MNLTKLGPVIDIFKSVHIHTGIYLGGGKIRMPQKLLDGPDIHTIFQ